MSPEESASRLESLFRAYAGDDKDLFRRSVPLLVVASGAQYDQLGPQLQIFWRTFLAEIGASSADTSEDISQKVDAYYAANPLPAPILAAIHSTITAANRQVALEVRASHKDDSTVMSAPDVEAVSQKQRALPLRMPRVFR